VRGKSPESALLHLQAYPSRPSLSLWEQSQLPQQRVLLRFRQPPGKICQIFINMTGSSIATRFRIQMSGDLLPPPDPSPSPLKHRGLRRLWKAFGYSFDGLRAAFASEAAFRQEVALLLVAVPAALWLEGGGLERALLIGSVLLILVAELLNSALEATIDRISTERHPLAKKAKDMGSAAVFLSSIHAMLVWILVLAG
jgi:diacylglycerol kinase (ATP)